LFVYCLQTSQLGSCQENGNSQDSHQTFVFLHFFYETSHHPRYWCKESYFRSVRIFCTAGKVNTRRMSQPDMESIFTKIIYEIFWFTITWIIKIIKMKCFVLARILEEHWCIYFCLQIPPRENWFQYVRGVYTTAINFPCISTLTPSMEN